MGGISDMRSSLRSSDYRKVALDRVCNDDCHCERSDAISSDSAHEIATICCADLAMTVRQTKGAEGGSE